MTGKEIAELILTCGTAGIREFDGCGLKFSFGAKEDVVLNESAPDFDPKEQSRNLEERESQIKQDKLEELRLSDPAAFEDAVRQNDLEIA